MKLTVFNEENFPKQQGNHRGTPAVRFGKMCAISLNGSATEIMELKEGDRLSMAQDEDDPANWFLFKDVNGFEVRLHTDKKTMQFNHRKLSDAIKECFGLDKDGSHRFLIGGQPTIMGKVKYFGLLITA